MISKQNSYIEVAKESAWCPSALHLLLNLMWKKASQIINWFNVNMKTNNKVGHLVLKEERGTRMGNTLKLDHHPQTHLDTHAKEDHTRILRPAGFLKVALISVTIKTRLSMCVRTVVWEGMTMTKVIKRIYFSLFLLREKKHRPSFRDIHREG